MSGLQRSSRFERGEDVVVMKFGGTSVEDEAAIRRLIAIVKSRLDAQPVVVVSALAKVTDQLLESGNAAAHGKLGSALATVRDIYVRHEQLADSLMDGSSYEALGRELRSQFGALETLLYNIEAAEQLDVKSQDELLGFGEVLSSKLVESALRHASIQACHVDARNCIVTDSRHGQASPLWDVTNQRLRDNLVPILASGRVAVLGGFIASTMDGSPTTLGRGGSDFSASIVGAALSATRVEIWTDVDGVMTTDPKLCPDARVIRKLSFEEAAELACFGAKVLHPATLAPAVRENIPVHVLNSRHPEDKGTEIGSRATPAGTISAITAMRNVSAVEVRLSETVNPELLGKVFEAFDRHSCRVDVMGTSLGKISLLVGSTAALPHVVTDLQGFADVKWENHRALVCLVGENIRRKPEVASRAFAAVSNMDVRVFCQGASERAISFLVDESRVEESVKRLHDLFFPKIEPARDWGGTSSAFCQAG